MTTSGKPTNWFPSSSLLWMKSVVIVLSYVLCFAEGDQTLEVGAKPNAQLEIASLFTSMNPKSTPLYICDASLGGIEYRPPVNMECNTKPEDTDITTVVDITIFFNDVTRHSIKGYECIGWRDDGEVGAHWLDHWANVKRTFISVSSDQCWTMIREKVDPNGDKLYRFTEEIWKTQNYHEMEKVPWYYISYLKTATIYNYRVQEVDVGISEMDGIVKSITPTLKPCHFNESICRTDYGVLVWNPSDVKTCRLMEGDKSNCMYREGKDGKTLSCPDLQLFMRGIELVEMCGVIFGSSNGVYFLQNEENQIFDNMATPQLIQNTVSRPRSRSKRDTTDAKIHPFEAEIKNNLNYLYFTVQNHTKEVIYRLEKEICEVNKRQIEMISTLAQSGHPSLTTRFMYNNAALRAEYVGDIMQIYQCIEIREYMFLEREECTYQWPVVYNFRQQNLRGFMEPLTHTIVPVPTKQIDNVLDRCKRFFFQGNNYIALFAKDRALQVNVDTLPYPGAGLHGKNFLPDLTFVPKGNLGTSDDDMESILRLFRTADQRNNGIKQERINLATAGVNILENQGFSGDAATSLFSSLFGGVGFLFAGVIKFFVWGIVFFLAVSVFFGLCCTGILCKIFLLPYKLIAKCCRCYRKRSRSSESCPKKLHYSDSDSEYYRLPF